MNQPVIIEVSHTEGDNQISFAVRGSVEWLNEVIAFAQFNLGFMTGKMWDESSEEQRDEIVAGINALRDRESYQGETITVSLAQPKEPQ